VIDPVGGFGHPIRVGWKTETRPGARCAVTETAPQPLHRRSGLRTRDLLSGDGADQGLEDQTGPPESPTRMASMELANSWVVGAERSGIVLQSGQRAETGDEPAGSVPPGIPDDLLTGATDPDRARAIGGACGQPPAVVGEPAVKRQQRGPEIERAFDEYRAGGLPHDAIIVTNDRDVPPREKDVGPGS